MASAKKLIAAAVLAGASLFGVADMGSARADGNDDAFVAALEDIGGLIGYGARVNPSGSIAQGKGLCGILYPSHGHTSYTPESLARQLHSNDKGEIPLDDERSLVDAAVRYYCPSGYTPRSASPPAPTAAPRTPAMPPIPPPSTAELRFIADMKSRGVTALDGRDSNMTSAGYTICLSISQGAVTPSAMDAILRLIEYRDFNEVQALAKKYLCPTGM